MTNDEAIAAAKELLAGMEGLTEGPWMRSGIRCKNPGDSLMVGPDGAAIYAIPIGRDHAGAFRDAGYLAKCSPSNLRPVLEAFLRMAEELKEASAFKAHDRTETERRAWNAAIEEAAKVAEKGAGMYDKRYIYMSIYDGACRDTAASIRNLKL